MTWTALVIGALGAYLGACVPEVPPAPEPVAPPPAADLGPDSLTVPLPITPGASFGALVQPWGLPPHAVREAALTVHDLATIRPEMELAVVLEDGDPTPVAVTYALDESRTLVVRREGEAWTPSVDEIPYELVDREVFLEIDSSLWEAGLSAGLRPSDLALVAQAYEFDVDFNTEIRRGATVGFVGEVRRSEGLTDRLERIHAMRLRNDGRVYEVVRFEDDDGIVRYFHPDGSSTERSFLRSPLAFSRVTSGFNPRRYHPVLKRRRPHNGTDFGAPTGTPVRAVASGTVTFAGRNGGHGNFVKLRHDGSVETSYSHLSRVHVRRGERVKQGQVVGRVGSTGMSTGPHLHYQMWKNGRFVDAMRADLPRGNPIPGHLKARFQEQVEAWLPRVPAG